MKVILDKEGDLWVSKGDGFAMIDFDDLGLSEPEDYIETIYGIVESHTFKDTVGYIDDYGDLWTANGDYWERDGEKLSLHELHHLHGPLRWYNED